MLILDMFHAIMPACVIELLVPMHKYHLTMAHKHEPDVFASLFRAES